MSNKYYGNEYYVQVQVVSIMSNNRKYIFAYSNTGSVVDHVHKLFSVE